MKKLFFALFGLLVFTGIANADKLTLVSPQTEVSPIVVDLDWRNINLDISNRNNILTVTYFKLNASGQRIPLADGTVRRTWVCKNIVDNPETPQDETSTCWSDIFMFSIRAQDVGTPIGRGLRQLILNKMKNDPTVFEPGNSGAFDD